MRLFDASDWGFFSYKFDENNELLREGFWFKLKIVPAATICFCCYLIIDYSIRNYRINSLQNCFIHDVAIFVNISILHYLLNRYAIFNKKLGIVNDWKVYHNNTSLAISTLFLSVVCYTFSYWALIKMKQLWILEYLKLISFIVGSSNCEIGFEICD